MELLKLISANEIIAQIISFLILVFLLRLFAWKRILGLLDRRKEKIASDFNKIEETKLEIAGLKADYEKKLNTIDEAASKKIQEAMIEGRKITEEIRKKAHLEAQDIIENARDNIKHELAKAKEELKSNVIDLTIRAAESVIQEKLTEGDDRKLVEDFLNRIDEIE